MRYIVIALVVISYGCRSSNRLEVPRPERVAPLRYYDDSTEIAKERRDFDKAESLGAVSLLQLIANPERFHGKRVIVAGYAVLEFEGQGIFPSRELAEVGFKNGVWLDHDFGSLPNNPEPRAYIPLLVEGVFDAKNGGHLGTWAGEICSITRIVRLAEP